MRPTIHAANWKMNMTLPEGSSFIQDFKEKLKNSSLEGKKIIIIPPFIHLDELCKATEDSAVEIGAQNCHQANEGAYTGEISAAMIRSTGARYVIIGHSERREYFEEGGELLAQKIDMAQHYGLIPIYCCGETLEQREKNESENVISRQIKAEIFHLSSSDIKNLIIAYEPVWAIGTGKTATPEQAQEMHASIRQKIKDQYDEDTAEQLPILYGGSVKPNNAKSLLDQQDVDGGLVGGASLNPQNFHEIIKADS